MKTTIFLYSVEGVQLDIYETKQPVSFKKIREFIEYKTPLMKNPHYNWYKDKSGKLKGVINHQSRSHLVEDLRRYMFCAAVMKAEERFPRLNDYKKYSKRFTQIV